MRAHSSLLPGACVYTVETDPSIICECLSAQCVRLNRSGFTNATTTMPLNAGTGRNGNGVTGAAAGVPFPIPQNGPKHLEPISCITGATRITLSTPGSGDHGNATLIRRDRRFTTCKWPAKAMTLTNSDKHPAVYKYLRSPRSQASGYLAWSCRIPLDQVVHHPQGLAFTARNSRGYASSVRWPTISTAARLPWPGHR